MHSLVEIVVSEPLRQKGRRKGLRGWQPILDDAQQPSQYHSELVSLIACHPMPTLETIETMLHTAGLRAGHYNRDRPKFSPSLELQQLRRERRNSANAQSRKSLSWQIFRLHRLEVRSWKALTLTRLLSRGSKGATLQRLMSSYGGRKLTLQPQPDEFADELETLFAGDPPAPVRPDMLDETPWSMGELQHAIHRLKGGRSADEAGLVIELLKHAPADLLTLVLQLFNTFLFHGDVPSSWRKTVFTMLAKKTKAVATTDFRPIANVRMMYKVFARMILGRIEDLLDASQPEEQHGFRTGRRIEEHLVTANIVLDKMQAANLPVWIVSIDFSKAFDRIDWAALWPALRGQGVSVHLIWLLQIVYHNQEGVVRGDSSTSRWFNIFGGVRQGCVLSPRLFCAVLQTALSEWRQSVASFGLDFGDGLPELLDLRFADDLLLFARSAQDAAKLLDDLVRCCSGVGLRLNVTKTKIVTSEAQAPAQLLTHAGSIVDILPPDASHKWLGCLLSSKGSRASSADVDFHLQAASRAFFANKQILLDRNVCLKQRLEFFDAVVTPVACFAAGHRAIFHADIRQFDVEFRRLLRRIVGPPADIQWDMPWHIILHHWNAKAVRHWEGLRRPTWGQVCLRSYWNFALHAANLPNTRWIKRALAWQPVGKLALGRPRNMWASCLETFARWKRWDSWETAALDNGLWNQSRDEFCQFIIGQ